MIEFEKNNGQLRITIPISNIEKLLIYQKGIRGLLRKIEVGRCDPALMENLKAVFELLSHLQPDDAFLAQHKEFLKEESNTRQNKSMV